ncbi:MAG: LLM class F420-dependent oxidoreductase [Rhodospirillaceae bacterium]|jgi:probable F420-dependent oxidoreductase|nr:LLM class F420-dependent oxidoreductase [Rhodospirillaceae bacterium]|tara:strand:- start:2401 stop:3408 length:1008 start_codon:yes stop_codon:yes gene_type:complete
MRVSAGLPTGMEGLTYPIPFSDPDAVIRIAKHAEKLDYHSVWGNDHMTTQHYVRAEFETPPRFWEPLITYSFVAAETTTLRFGTGILVLPMRRDIVVAAKQLATLDHFSGGRLEIGVGIGAYREEFLALQPGETLPRGKIVDEGIPALKQLLTDRVASFKGEFFAYEDVELYPKPLQDHVPIYIGGNNENNLRRAAKWGDGWLPAAVHLDRIRDDIKTLRELTEAEGREFADIEVAPQYIVHIGKTREAALESFNQTQMCAHLTSLRKSTLKGQGELNHEDINLIGTVEDVVERANLLGEAGVTHLLGLYFAANNIEELLDQMQIFAEDVVPRLC